MISFRLDGWVPWDKYAYAYNFLLSDMIGYDEPRPPEMKSSKTKRVSFNLDHEYDKLNQGSWLVIGNFSPSSSNLDVHWNIGAYFKWLKVWFSFDILLTKFRDQETKSSVIFLIAVPEKISITFCFKCSFWTGYKLLVLVRKTCLKNLFGT